MATFDTRSSAATRLGISLAEYNARKVDGQKWCTKCQCWHMREAFARDSSRGDRYRSSCRDGEATALASPAYDEKIDEITLAYLAGVIDSDGFISITRGRHGGKLYHAAIVGIAGTRSEPHDLAASLWGGKVHAYTPKNPRHRIVFQWSRTGDQAHHVIGLLLPYLRVKIDQAWLAIELQEHVLAGRGDDPFPWFSPDYDPIPYRDELRAEVVEVLNQDRRRPFSREIHPVVA